MVTPNLPEARALTGLGEGADAERARAGGARRSGPEAVVVTGGHADDGADLLCRRRGAAADRGPALSRTAPRTARAAPTPRRWPRSSRAASSSLEAARWAREVAAEAVGHGLREIGAGAGPVDVFGIGRIASRHRAAAIIACVKLVRMKPGHGDVLLAEGDPEVAEDEERLIEEFRRQLDLGMWAAVPTAERDGRREAVMVRDFAEVPRDAERVIFFPPAAGG